MRKGLVLIMVLAFILTQLLVIGNGFTVANTDISVSGYSVTNTSGAGINKDDDFNLHLVLTTATGVNISNVFLIIDQSSSFYASNGKSQYDQNVFTGSFDLPLKYKGDGKELKFSIKYDKQGVLGSQEADLSVYIKEAVPESTSTPILVDTKTFKPILSILGDTDIPTGEAGKKLSIALPIKNSSLHAAKNVEISLDTSDLSKFPFKLEKMNFVKTLDQIAANETKTVTFDFTVADNADSGDYTLKFNFTYTNPYNDEMNSSDTIFIKITNNNTSPQVIVSKVIINPQPVVPGSTVKVGFVLKNVGSMQALNVKTTIKGLDSGAFTVANSTDVQYIENLDGSKTEAVDYTLNAADGMNSGRYGLSIKLDYTSMEKKAYSEEYQFFIKVEKPVQGEALLTLDSIQAPTDVIQAGSDFKISLNVSNLSSTAAKNVKISVTCDKEIISKSLSTIVMDSLDGNSVKPIEFNMSTTSDAVSKNYPIALNLEYDTIEDGKTVKNTLSEYVGVYIQAVEKEVKKTIPRLIINSYNFGNSSKKAGETFDVGMSILNTSRDIPVSNLKITFTSDDGTFTIAGSNTCFVEYLDTKQKFEKSIKLSAKPDASPKAYPLSINFEYEDSNGNQYTSKETISIPIIQDLRFVTGDINLSPEAYPGQQAPVNVEFYNMGKTTLYNLMVKVDGDFDGQKSSYYVGNFDPGRSDSFDGTVTPKAPGQVKGAIVFTYEDAAGKQSEVKKEFTLNVIQMPAPQKLPDMLQSGMNGQKKTSKNLIGPFNLFEIILMGLGLIVVIIVIVILRKKQIRKREMMFDEIS